MVRYKFEIIELRDFDSKTFKFIEFPHREWFIAYGSANHKNINFLEKKTANSSWSIEIPQNDTDFFELTKIDLNITDIALFFDNKGDLILLYNNLNSQNNHELFKVSSFSYGKKWDGPNVISHEFSSWKLHSNPILIQKGIKIGTFVVPVENEIVKRSFVIISEDNGKNWHISLYIEPNDELDHDYTDEKILGSYSPVVIEGYNDDLILFCKISGENIIQSFISYDYGMTWFKSEQFPIFQIENQGDFDAIRLRNNENHESLSENILILGSIKIEEKYQIIAKNFDLKSLELKEVWKYPTLYSSPPRSCQCFQDSSGMIHLLYNFGENKIYHYWQTNS